MAKNFTSEEFERFLFWLDKDRGKAGQKYEEIRSSLARILYSRGCSIAEELASETMDRAVTACQKIIDTYEGEPIIFFHAIAKNVFLEHTRQPKFTSLEKNDIPNDSASDTKNVEAEEIKYECLQKCLNELSPEDRAMITKYHSVSSGVEEKKEMKRELERIFNISYKSLRVRAHRIRKKLHRCIERCARNS